MSVLIVTAGHKKVQKKIQAEELMRKFSESKKEQCKYVQNIKALSSESSNPKKLATGSTYAGTRNVLGMHGHGTYKFPDGWMYDGKFDDGQFHGEGQLISPNGEIIRGTWEHGEMKDGILTYRDGQEFRQYGWQYLRNFDRRFHIEIVEGLQPVPDCFETAQQPPRDIPPGHYDTCDGFYDPNTKIIFSYNCRNEILRSPNKAEQKWIIENCRSAENNPVEILPGLYEKMYKPTKYVSGDSTSTIGTDDDVSHYTWGDADFEEKWNLLQEFRRTRRSRISNWSLVKTKMNPIDKQVY